MGGLARQYAKIPETKRNSPLRIQRTKSSQPIKTPADGILFLQRTIGNQAVQRLIKSGTLQTKLKIGQPGDVYEQEADRVADAVMRMPEPGVQRQVEPEEEEEEMLQAKPLAEEITPLVQRQVEPEEEEEELQAKATSGRISEVNSNLGSQIQSLKGGGQPLSKNDRTFFEPRFGRDFSQVRVHTYPQAAESARMVNARAFTIGQGIVFGEGQYDPVSKSGKYLLAHELVHTVQQGKGIQRQIQLTRLGIYSDATKWKNDPAKISDKDLKATDEYTWLNNIFRFTKSEILLALRLIIRYMHTRLFTLYHDKAKATFILFALPYLQRAKRQSGTASQAEALAGKLKWTVLGPPDFSNPATAKSAFTKWLLVPKASKPTDTSTMNCWELVLYSAYRGGFTTKKHLKAIYTSAAAKTGMDVPKEIEKKVCGSRFSFDLTKPKSREPIRGDIVIFNQFAGHVAISLGTKTTSGKHEVMSLWSVPSRSGNRVYRTTIETLAGAMKLTRVNFCTPNW